MHKIVTGCNIREKQAFYAMNFREVNQIILTVNLQTIVCIWVIHKEQGYSSLQEEIVESLKDTFTFNVN